MLKDAEKRGLKKGDYVLEYTSGNTGISVAWVAKLMGYKPLILIPENIVEEKKNLIKAIGAQLRIIRKEEDGDKLAEDLAKELNGLYLHQTDNLANFRAHYETTGPELYSQVNNIDCFVMGAGTGGTIYGIGKYLKEKNERIKVVLLVPKGSMLQEEFFGKKEEDMELLEGFSYHSYSELLKRAMDEEIIDDIRVVSSREAIEGAKMLINSGILGGFTAGANFYHSKKIKKDCKNIATIVADSIIRYPSRLSLIQEI
jgi:cysteine synthase A